jgi:hypothetical protein
MALKLSNNAISSLLSAITADSTSIILKSGDGAKFPSLGAGDYFPATLSKSDGSLEVVRVTGRSGDTLTATRAQEGTTALSFSAGALIELRLTAATVEDINTITSLKVTTALGFTPLDAAKRGAINGVASLDGSGLVPALQLPSYVDDVLEYANLAAFPGTGEAGKIYVALDTNKTYRWSGSVYIYITSGAVDSVGSYTGVVTAQNLLDAIKTVDGASSGLDADTLDGNHASAFYLATNPSGFITSSGTAANVSGIVAIANGGTGAATATAARTNLGLGTAATTDATAYATAAQGTKADNALTALNPSYTGTLTGGTGIINIGSGQIYKDAGGQVGIGQTGPVSKLHVSQTLKPQVTLTDATLGQTYGGAIQGYGVTGQGGYLDLGTWDNSVFTRGIRLTELCQSIQFSTGSSNTERMRIDSSALNLTGLQGMKFQATQNASSDANTLDDYEEGTFTPAVSGAGSPTYLTQYGIYTKIGNTVCVTGKIKVSGSTLNANTIAITGLPFAGKDTNDAQQRTSSMIYGDWIGMGAYSVTGRLRIENTSIVGVRDTGGTSTYWTYSELGSTTWGFHFCLTYIAD